jgi:hypothetical protein
MTWRTSSCWSTDGRRSSRRSRRRATKPAPYIAAELGGLLDQSRFHDKLEGAIVGLGGAGSGSGSGDESRVDDVLLPRLYELAGR